MLAGTLEIQMMASMARLSDDMRKAESLVGGTMGRIDQVVGKTMRALGGIGGGLSAAAFGAWIKGAIDAADALNDLGKSTDIAVGKLAGLKLAGRQSGGDLESTAQAINKLSLNMGKNAAQFAAIGITAKQPLEAFKQLSDIFVSIKDPQLRAAVAAEALGKSWAGAAPLLAEGSKKIQEMVDKGELLSGMNQDMADASDEFNDRLAELQTALGGTATKIAVDLLPILTALVEDMTSAATDVNALDSSFNPLTETLRALIIVVGNVSFVLKGIGTEIGVLAAQADALGLSFTDMLNPAAAAAKAITAGAEGWRQFNVIGEEARANAQKARTDFDAWEKKMLGTGAAAIRLADQTDALSRRIAANERATLSAAQAAKLKAFADQEGAKKAAAAAAAALAEYGKLIGRIQERIDLGAAELKAGRELTDVEKFEIKTLADLAAAKHAVTPAQLAAAKAKIEEAKATDLLVQIQKSELVQAAQIAQQRQQWKNTDYEQAGAALRDIEAANAQNLASVKDRVQSMKDEAEALQVAARLNISLAEATELVTMARLAERQAKFIEGSEGYNAIQKEIDARKELLGLIKNRADYEALKGVWESIDKTAHDVFVNIFEGGSNAFKKLGQTLKSAVLDLLYQMTVKKWIISMGTSMTGGIASAADAATGGVGSGLLSMAGNAFGLTAAGGALSAGMAGASAAMAGGATFGVTGAIGSIPAAIGTGATGVAGALGSLGAGASAALAAVPVAGWIALGVMALMSFIKDKGGPKADGKAGADLNSLIGTTDNSLAGGVSPAVQGLQQAYDQLAKAFGSEAAIQFGIGISRDPKGTAPTFLDIVGRGAGGSLVFNSQDRNVGRSDEELEAALKDGAARALLAALQASDMPAEWAAMFDAVGDGATMAAAEIDAAINRISGIQKERAELEALLFDLTATDLEKLTRVRDAERAAVHESNRALLEQVYAQQDLKSALEATNATIHSAARTALQELAASLRGMHDDVDAANAGVAGSRAAIFEAYSSAQDRLNGLLEKSRQQTLAFGNSLRDYLAGLSTGQFATETPAGQYQALQRRLFEQAELARGGNQGARDGLTNAANAFLQAAQARSRSAVDLAMDRASVRTLLDSVLSTLPAAAQSGAGPSLDDQILAAQQEVADYLALANETGTSIEGATLTVADNIAALRDAYDAARAEQLLANTRLEVALAALDTLGLSEAVIDAFLAGQTGASVGDFATALGVSDETINALQDAMGFTDEELQALSDALNVSVAPAVYAALGTALGMSPALVELMAGALGVSPIQMLQLQTALNLSPETALMLATVLGLDPAIRAELAVALGVNPAAFAPLGTALGFDAAQVETLGTAIGLAVAAQQTIDMLSTVVGYSDAAQALSGSLATIVDFSPAALDAIDALAEQAGFSPEARAIYAALASRVGFNPEALGTIGMLGQSVGLKAGLSGYLAQALDLSPGAVAAINALISATTQRDASIGIIEQAYASIGRSGFGTDVSQIDSAGFSYWLNALQSGSVSSSSFQSAFLSDAAAWVQARPDDPLSDYVKPYLHDLGIPGFAVGTNYVPQDMLAQIHEGEAIVPKAYNPAAGGNDNSELVTELREMKAELKAANAKLEKQGKDISDQATSMQRLTMIVNDVTLTTSNRTAIRTKEAA